MMNATQMPLLPHKHLNEPLPTVHEYLADLPGRLDGVLNRATAKNPAERYPDALSLAADFRQALSGEAAVSPLPLALRVEENPYKGLRAFQESDVADFFGRETLVERLVERLRERDASARFLAVVGPSGSGKSSAVKAGLIPALRRGALPGSEQWFVVEMLPGAFPLEELEASLLRIAVNPPSSLIEQLRADQHGLLRAIKRVLLVATLGAFGLSLLAFDREGQAQAARTTSDANAVIASNNAREAHNFA